MTGGGNRAITTVIDAGARYGMHPSWRRFAGELRYVAFEPDRDEAERLRREGGHPGMEVSELALARHSGERDLYITKHRGYCSLLQVDERSEWFGRYRPGEGDLVTVSRVPTTSVDEYAAGRGLDIDFLKIDTEGTELEVLEGAARELEGAILGLRVNVNFQRCYKGQAVFSDIDRYLDTRDFFLLNLDYFGRGVPRNGLFRNPDPLTADTERYGILIGTDAVWLKHYERVCERLKGGGDPLPHATLKYAYFCMLNHAGDVGIDILHEFVSKRGGTFSEGVRASLLYRGLRKLCAEYLGRWRVYPDAQWEFARTMFKEIFGMELEGGWRYWELLRAL